ncbi:MAG: aldose epimerase family protein [Pseudomonadales bacterium]|nr:aldose epimerase family protein [Pseudomonadales bacterium]
MKSKDTLPESVFPLCNESGMRVEILARGATIWSLSVPDRYGQYADVVLGLATPAAYDWAHPYFGSVLGRYANRIAQARFSLVGQSYQLSRNEGVHHLHGGKTGFDRALWQVCHYSPDQAEPVLELFHRSPDGDQGYPGTLDCRLIFSLRNDNTLTCHYECSTDAPTVVSLSHHPYFNLSGNAAQAIDDHVLWIDAACCTPTDEEGIPLGAPVVLDSGATDFQTERQLGESCIDRNYVLKRPGDLTQAAASVHHPATGRFLQIFTTQPGLQFYTGDQIGGPWAGKQGVLYRNRQGLCLEAQNFPDAPNQAGYPVPVLLPGQLYRQQTCWHFSTV